MYFDFDLPLPANTAKPAPVLVKAPLTTGIIHRLEIEFPAGCAGLAYVAIRQGIHQLWPLNDEGAFHSDDHVIAWDDHHLLDQPPFTLDLVGWNLDDTYPHTPIVRIGLLPAELLEAPQKSAGLLGRLLKRMGG